MRYFVTMVLIGLFLCLPATAAFSQASNPENREATENPSANKAVFSWANTTFDLSAGYRKDSLSWSIAGNTQGSNPNIRSELKWSDLTIYQLKLSNRTIIKERFFLRGHLDYGFVNSGSNRDSDYNGDDRSLEFSRSNNGVNGNNVWDGSIGFGPRLVFHDSTITVCPLLGYAVAEQDLNIVDGFQAISNPPPATPPLGPIAGLDSRYEARWKGPWLGVDLMVSVPYRQGPFTEIGILFSGEYHWIDFDAEADWNLRDDYRHPVSFTHRADGNGYKFGTEIRFETDRRWGVNAGMLFQKMTTGSGSDRVYYADGSIAETRLNKVRWQSITFAAGFSYQF